MRKVGRVFEGRTPAIGVGLVVLGLLLATVGGWWWTQGPPDPATGSGDSPVGDARAPMTRADLDDLAATVDQSLRGDPLDRSGGSAFLRRDAGPVYVALRSERRWVGSAWGIGGTTAGAVDAAVAEASRAARDAPRPDTAEVCLSHSYRPVNPEGQGTELLSNLRVGLLGLEIRRGSDVARYSPTLMISQNWDFGDVLAIYAEAHETTVQSLAGPDTHLRVFGCEQALVTLGGTPRAVHMFRGNSLVPQRAVDARAVSRLADLMGGWLTSQVDPDGRMLYEYWPSRDEESDDNNMIRQWMATVALGRLADHRGSRRLQDLAERNIRYNLEMFYEEENGLGLIVEPSDGDVKLGAVALAALAVVEHPARESFAREEAALRRTVDFLWRPDGSFATFYRPAGRSDNQNFYPGEALLLWSVIYRETEDPALLDRFMTSFRHYRRWHLEPQNRNPAFVPWHTQAYANVWRETGNPDLLRFVHVMNDWLLDMQQWENAPFPDVRGRFYDPGRPEYGEPHASSTGVYLEGLVEAYRLAERVGDSGRAERYWRAIRRGLRNVMQLQFADEVDMFYVHDTERVRGGIRTEVYDNVIRVDNVQHNLMAVLRILESWPRRTDR